MIDDNTLCLWLKVSDPKLRQAVEKLQQAARLAYEAQQELQSYNLIRGELWAKAKDSEAAEN